MAEPFIGEIYCFGFHFAPRGYAFCNGQLMSIDQNAALFAVIGTLYGGDGQTTFALPNLQGRIPMHWGSNSGFDTVIGEQLGQAAVTLTVNQLPQHQHTVTAAVAGEASERSALATGTSFISTSTPPNFAYQSAPPSVTAAFSPKAIGPSGGSQPHENMQPYLALNFCIALEGVFPSRN